jgi:hypothetical protein
MDQPAPLSLFTHTATPLNLVQQEITALEVRIEAMQLLKKGNEYKELLKSSREQLKQFQRAHKVLINDITIIEAQPVLLNKSIT